MDDRIKLLPTAINRKKEHRGIRVKFPIFAIVTVGLPFTSFLFCVYWSTVYNFRESTATHCQVDNYLPSVSAAIGSFSPQKYVWLFSILLHYIPRIYIAGLYYNHLQSVVDPNAASLVHLTYRLNVLEVTCLLGLTLVSSTDFYPAHATFFVVFIITSVIYMQFSCYLLKWRRFRRLVQLSSQELFSLRLKIFFAFANLSCIFLAGYSFVRHNTYCEAGVYSLFAIFEYIVVLSNMAFHLTAYLDFQDKLVYLSCFGISFSGSKSSHSSPSI